MARRGSVEPPHLGRAATSTTACTQSDPAAMDADTATMRWRAPGITTDHKWGTSMGLDVSYVRELAQAFARSRPIAPQRQVARTTTIAKSEAASKHGASHSLSSSGVADD